jgi:hypothetical protein
MGYEEDNAQFYLKQLRPLVGGTITNLVDAGEGFYGFRIKCKSGVSMVLILSQDDEGNGPGAFFLEEDKPDAA